MNTSDSNQCSVASSLTPLCNVIANDSSRSCPATSINSDPEGIVSVELLPVKSGLIPKSWSALVWKYFVSINPLYEEYESHKLVCLLCQGNFVNKIVAVGKDNPSPSSLMSHLQVHHFSEYEQLQSQASAKAKSSQSCLTTFLSPKVDIKSMFQMAYCCWIVECNKPLTIGSTSAFQDMIKLLDHCMVIPERRDVLNCLDLLWIDVSKQGKGFTWEQLFQHYYWSLDIHVQW